MPILQLNINVQLDLAPQAACLSELACLVAGILAKPPSDVMVHLHQSTGQMNDSSEAVAFVELQALSGLNQENCHRLCTGIATILQGYFSIENTRIYCNFTEVPPSAAWRFVGGQAMNAVKKSPVEPERGIHHV